MSWIPKKENELKIVLVGDSGVGKTQLIWKYVPFFFVSEQNSSRSLQK